MAIAQDYVSIFREAQTFGGLMLSGAILFIAALLSTLQTAFMHADKFAIKLLDNQGRQVGKRLSFLLAHSQILALAFYLAEGLGLLLFSISFYYSWNSNLAKQSNFGSFLIVILGGATLFLVFTQLLPKLLAPKLSNNFLYRFSAFLYYFYLFFSYIISWVDKSIGWIEKKVFGFSKLSSITQAGWAEKEWRNSAPSEETAEVQIDAQILSNALDFNKIKAREFMVPRTEIIALPLNASIEQALSLFLETEISRIVIYEETLDNVKGFIHSKSLFNRPEKIADILQPLLLIPQSMTAPSLLQAFSANRKSIAIVIDEFGGTAGLVTVEDVVEVVFGEINDEYDTEEDPELVEQVLDANSYRFSARLAVDYVNQKYELNLPEGDYTTLGGLVLFYAERIPLSGEKIEIGNFIITILEASAHKIHWLKIEKKNHHFR